MIIAENIPNELRQRPQWVAWNMESRKPGGNPTKVPKNPNTGGNAKADAPETWGTYDAAVAMADRKGFSGVGYEFSVDDHLVGVDLDNCRDRETGKIQPWAQTIIDKLGSYSEVSPSGNGVKLWVRGKLPCNNSGKADHALPADKYPSTTDEPAGFEVYQHGRYFCVTGEHVEGTPTTIVYKQADLDDVYREFFGDQTAKTNGKLPPPPPSGKRRGLPDHLAKETPKGLNGIKRCVADQQGDDIMQAVACLQVLGAKFRDDYDKWLHIGMVLHSVNDDDMMRAAWDGWSRKSGKYEAGACAERWAGFKAGENGEKLTIASLVNWAGENSADEWDEPASLDVIAVPAWPAEGVFSEALHEYVAAVAESLQVPQDGVAMTMLGMFAVAFAKKIEVHIRGDHREPVNLFVVNVAPSGERKSAICRELVKPLNKYEREVNAALEEEVAVYESRKRTLAKQLSAAESSAANPKGDIDRQCAERDRDNLARELAAFEKDAVRKLTLTVGSDCTPERLDGHLAEQGGRLGLLDTEGGLLSMIRGKYAKNAEPNTDSYCKGYSGDEIRVDRVKRPAIVIPNPALTIVVYIQPEILRGMVTTSHLRGVGLLARFWYVLGRSFVGHRLLSPDPIPNDVRSTYEHLIRRALELRVPTDEDGEPEARTLELETAALAVWLDFAERVEIGLRDGGELDGIGDWGGKIAGGVARIAGILHGIEHVAMGTISGSPISKATMEGAVKVGGYLISHARAAFIEMGSDPDIELARRIVKWIEAEKLTTFTRRDAHLRFKDRDRKADELDGPLAILERTGHVRAAITAGPGKTGGRPKSKQFVVNPKLASNRQEVSGLEFGGQK